MTELVLVTVETPVVHVTVSADGAALIETGFQGPPGVDGAQGPIGPAGGSALTATAAIALSGHRMVTLNSAAAAIYADASTLDHMGKVLGMTVSAIGAGGTASILRSGDLSEPSWTWTLNSPVYLGLAGLLTQTPPAAPSLFSLIVGFPITATRLYISLREPILLNDF